MKVLLDIPDKKAPAVLEVLKSIPYIKMQPLSDSKANLIKEIKESVNEMKLVKQGTLNARAIEDLLNEL